MSPQMGRPKAENPKSKQIMVRLDAETDRKLEELAEFFKEKKVAVVRRGIEKLYAEIKKIEDAPTYHSVASSTK